MVYLTTLNCVALAYGLGSIKSAQLLNNGKTSTTWQVKTVSGQFIIKTTKSSDQADLEFAISNAVRKINSNLTPEILLSEENEPFFLIDYKFYQVQLFLEGTKIQPSLQGAVKSCRQMRIALDSFDNSFSSTDSNPLLALWFAKKDALLKQQPILFQQILTLLPELEHIDKAHEVWIHGDLGKWNLLVAETKRVAIIDFGESRRGPRFMDYAALFQGFMPDNPQDFPAYLNEFLALSGIPFTNCHDFLMTALLWLVKGLLIVIGEQASLADVFQNEIAFVVQRV